jgi:hypothetical protein
MMGDRREWREQRSVGVVGVLAGSTSLVVRSTFRRLDIVIPLIGQ